MEVLGLVAQGRSTDEIGVALSVSVHTVLSHIRNARTKLNAPNKLVAVVTAMQQGLLKGMGDGKGNPTGL